MMRWEFLHCCVGVRIARVGIVIAFESSTHQPDQGWVGAGPGLSSAFSLLMGCGPEEAVKWHRGQVAQQACRK